MTQGKQNVNVSVTPAPPTPSEEAFVPLVDIYEAENGTIMLLAELPGVAPGKVDLRVDKGVLTIWADGKAEDLGPQYARTYTSFTTGEYFRAFALSDEVDRDQIEASLTDGLLTVKLPRGAAATTRKIEIKSE